MWCRLARLWCHHRQAVGVIVPGTGLAFPKMLAQEPHPVLLGLRLGWLRNNLSRVCRFGACSSFVNKSLLEQSYAQLSATAFQRFAELQQRPCGLHSLKYLLSGPFRKSLLMLLEKIILFQEQTFPDVSFPFFCLFPSLSSSFLLLFILPQLHSSFIFFNFFLQQNRLLHCFGTLNTISWNLSYFSLLSSFLDSTITVTKTSRPIGSACEQIGIQSSKIMRPGPLISLFLFLFFSNPHPGYLFHWFLERKWKAGGRLF